MTVKLKTFPEEKYQVLGLLKILFSPLPEPYSYVWGYVLHYVIYTEVKKIL